MRLQRRFVILWHHTDTDRQRNEFYI